jgi:hypothetical protein
VAEGASGPNHHPYRFPPVIPGANIHGKNEFTNWLLA